tara:strand:+ start:4547 stop:5476 length:930 start_codon:yes stop_codon:yes gene_type:complete
MRYLEINTKVLKPRFYYFIVIFLFSTFSVKGQEFNCDVTVNNDLIEGASFTYITELEQQIEDYINEYKWTNIEFQEHERIVCQIQIVIESGNSNFDFSSRIVFSLRRPIFNTNTETTSIILTDDTWKFNYPQGRSFIHDELQFDELTGLLDFFINLGLGYDFDSFSPLGGTPYFLRAQNIVDLAQTTSAIGWSRSTNNRRNRYTLITDLLNNSYEPLREAYYTYHRKGLDLFVTDETQARANVLEALKQIRDAKRRATSNYLFDVFFDTKSREIAGIFEGADSRIKLQAYGVLLETDQGHLSEYSTLQN